MFVAPEWAMFSRLMMKTAAAVRDSGSSVFETEVTLMSIRSSRLRSVKSADFCCDYAGSDSDTKVAERAAMRMNLLALSPTATARLSFADMVPPSRSGCACLPRFLELLIDGITETH